MNGYTQMIIGISHDGYFFAWFALNNQIEPNKDEIYEENLLQISKKSFLVTDRGPVEIIDLHRKW